MGRLLAVEAVAKVNPKRNIDKYNPSAKYTFDHSRRLQRYDLYVHSFQDLSWVSADTLSTIIGTTFLFAVTLTSELFGSPSCQLA